MYAHTQTILPRDWGRQTVLNSSHCHFHCARGFVNPVLAHMLNSLVRVSRREKENHFVQLILSRCNESFTQTKQIAQQLPQRPHRKRKGKYDKPHTGFLRFLLSNFRYSLTLFSKSFASFPHGTCTLSVSHQYLALDGIYHQLRAAIPNNSTLQLAFKRPGTRESHPPSCPVPRDLARPIAHLNHNSVDSHDEQFPLQSPLLRESWLVSFPPLNNMLKFSGSSCLS